MGRKKIGALGTLTIRPEGQNSFLLFGYVNGKKVRLKSAHMAELEAKKLELEQEGVAVRTAMCDLHHLPPSWITLGQLREAESAFQRLGNMRLTLAQCVEIGIKKLGTGEPVAPDKALADYKTWMEDRRLSEKHIEETLRRLRLFFKWAKVASIQEIDPKQIDRFCKLSKDSANTRLHNATKIQAFFNYASSHTGGCWLKESPFQTDMRELKKAADAARPRPEILSPDQTEALMKQAVSVEGGFYAPYVAFCVFGGMRGPEAAGISKDDLRLKGDAYMAYISGGDVKTSAQRWVTLPECITPLIKQCLERGFIDADDLGELPRKAREKIAEGAGVDKDWQQNILRHTGVSYYFQKTGDAQETARWAGHDTSIMFKHYVHLAEDGDHEKFYAITPTLPRLTPFGEVIKVA